MRILVAVALLVTLYVVYAAQVRGFDPFAPGKPIDPKYMADFARAFAMWCLIVQFCAIILITPIVVADAIAREKERRALDFLFVTALTDREIILGKLGSRLAYMTGVVLTGLPILTLTEMFGGVDPNLLWCGYASLFATLLSLGTLSLYCSVVSNTALQATVRSYAAAAGYLMICPCLIVPLVQSEAAIAGMIVYVIANLAFAFVLVLGSIYDLRPRAEILPPLPVVPVKRVRPVIRRRPQLDEAAPIVNAADAPPVSGWDPDEWRAASRPIVWEPPELPRAPLPPVDERRPLMWKEVHLHSFTAALAGSWRAAGMILILTLAPAMLLWVAVVSHPGSGPDVAAFSTGLVKVGTTVLGGLLGLAAIVHSVNAVTRERERDTLDSLLSLPVDRDEILAAKWLGGLVSLRLVAVALLGVWLFGVATGGLHPFAFVALGLAVAAVLEFLASLGLWLSTVSTTSLRANMAAVLCLLLIAVGPMVLAQYIDMLAPYSWANRMAADAVWKMLMPAEAWMHLCLGWREYAKAPAGAVTTILYGALGYAVAAWLLCAPP